MRCQWMQCRAKSEVIVTPVLIWATPMHMATLHIVQSMLCQTNAKYLQTYSQFVSSLVCWYCADIVVLHSVVCCYCADIVVILWEVLWISTLGCCIVVLVLWYYQRCAGIVMILVLHCDDIFSGVLILQWYCADIIAGNVLILWQYQNWERLTSRSTRGVRYAKS